MSVNGTASQSATLDTTWGPVRIAVASRGLQSCRLPKAPEKAIPFRVLRVRLPRRAAPMLKKAVDYAHALLEGRKPGAPPPMDPSIDASVPPFRARVWQVMRTIPRGMTMTYTELARRAGSPAAFRAAGSACGANPVPLFTPCHRVVAAGEKPGGFSSGLAWKYLLLNGEGGRL